MSRQLPAPLAAHASSSVGGRLLTISDLAVEATLPSRKLVILDHVDVEIRPGEIVGVVGESGSGKTTLARAVVGLLERNVSVTSGSIELGDQLVRSPDVNQSQRVRGSQVGMVFQDASRSLNPLFKVHAQLAEVLRRHESRISKEQIKQRSEEVLRQMRIDDPERVLGSYPHQLSGGLRQRVAIGLAVITRPSLVIADECTTALDVTTQTKVVELFRHLVNELRIGLLFVTHDLMLASDLCDRVVVMSEGKVVESGSVLEVLDSPREPYTQRLLAAIPAWN
ncbi:MAG: ABC transporter ATP-binding protein [Nocardioidaceae bacterium]